MSRNFETSIDSSRNFFSMPCFPRIQRLRRRSTTAFGPSLRASLRRSWSETMSKSRLAQIDRRSRNWTRIDQKSIDRRRRIDRYRSGDPSLCKNQHAQMHVGRSRIVFGRRWLRQSGCGKGITQIVCAFLITQTRPDGVSLSFRYLKRIRSLQDYEFCIDPILADVLVFAPGTDLHDYRLVVDGWLILQDKASISWRPPYSPQ